MKVQQEIRLGIEGRFQCGGHVPGVGFPLGPREAAVQIFPVLRDTVGAGEKAAGVDHRHKDHLPGKLPRRKLAQQLPHCLDAHIFVPVDTGGHHQGFSGFLPHQAHPLDGLSPLHGDGKGENPRNCCSCHSFHASFSQCTCCVSWTFHPAMFKKESLRPGARPAPRPICWIYRVFTSTALPSSSRMTRSQPVRVEGR